MAVKQWEVDEAGVKALCGEPGVIGHLTTLANEAVAKARASAPVRTGGYRDSLRVTGARTVDGKATVGFGSDSSHWHFVEYGTATNAPYRVLGAATETVADTVQHL